MKSYGLQETEFEKAWRMGELAQEKGLGPEDNPYPAQSFEFEAWSIGWEEEKKKKESAKGYAQGLSMGLKDLAVPLPPGMVGDSLSVEAYLDGLFEAADGDLGLAN